MISSRMIACVTAAMLMLAATVVYAGRGGMGMGHCNENVSIDNFKQFQKDTGTQRDEMMVKRIELQREQAAKSPDKAKVATLKQELTALRTQIHDAGKKYGMFADCDQQQDCWSDGGCGMNGSGDTSGKSKDKKHGGAGCNSCNKKAK